MTVKYPICPTVNGCLPRWMVVTYWWGVYGRRGRVLRKVVFSLN
jgi:hypothetical protein